MGTNSFYQISLVASYIAGMVALFAPCCISYLLPSYLGNIFKERKHILFMTIIYSLGIFVVMLPVVLGAKALSNLFFRFHDTTYIFGSIFMFFVAIISFLGIKLPIPHITSSRKLGGDVASTFILGIFSGITSACCAPVLIGVVALSTLTPTIVQSLTVGAFYVLGMVTPLYLGSFFIDRKNLLEKPYLKKKLATVKVFSTEYPIFVSNVIAFFIFLITSLAMFVLAYSGNLGMDSEAAVTRAIQKVAVDITEITSGISWINFLVLVSGVYLMYRFIKLSIMKEEKERTTYTCPMHPRVLKSKKGKCPDCGMNLIKKENRNVGASGHAQHSEHADHASHDHHMHHAMMAENFKKRLFVSIPLTLFILILSPQIGEWFGFSVSNILDTALINLSLFVLATSVFLYGGKPFFREAKNELKSRNYGMMTLVSLAILASYLFSVASTFYFQGTTFYWEMATLIIAFLFGHWMEMRAVVGTGGALKELAKLIPPEAHLIRGKGKERKIKSVPTEELKKGDVVLVKPGEKIPADAVVIKGSSSVNESMITGESRPIDKAKDSNVVGGTINGDGSLTIKVTRTGKDSALEQIKKLVRNAQETKPRVQNLAQKAANYLTIIAIVVGVGTFAYWFVIAGGNLVFALTLSITVIVITCPHALGLAIPTVTTITSSKAAANGILIRDMKGLEAAKDLDYVVFDKTGTLTKGEFGVTKILPEKGIKKSQLLKLASAVEINSEHAIAKGIVKVAQKKNINVREATKFKAIKGEGVKAKVGKTKVLVGNAKFLKENGVEFNEVDGEVGTYVYVAKDKKYQGLIVLGDDIRKESKSVVKKLHKRGIKVAMLTGDKEKIAKKVGRKLNIDTVFAEVLPDEKVDKVKSLQRKGFKVAMVGDGVNDAAALTQANVGIAIGAGTDVAIESAEIVLVRSNPSDVGKLINLAAATDSKMKQNLVWATGYNLVAIPIAAGVLLPWGIFLRPQWGALIMSASSVIVVINALSLRKFKL